MNKPVWTNARITNELFGSNPLTRVDAIRRMRDEYEAYIAELETALTEANSQLEILSNALEMTRQAWVDKAAEEERKRLPVTDQRVDELLDELNRSELTQDEKREIVHKYLPALLCPRRIRLSLAAASIAGQREVEVDMVQLLPDGKIFYNAGRFLYRPNDVIQTIE